MKILKKLFITIVVYLLVVNVANSQSLTPDYLAAIGIRSGETSGITFKYNTGSASSIEFLAGIWSDWLNLTALFEKNTAAFNVSGLRWYYGAGGHISFATGKYYNEGRFYRRGDDYALGVDGIVGIEYKIPPIPFCLSLDIKPLMEFYKNGDLYMGIDPGIGVKFTF
jgi:hypothetical protein